MEIDAQTTTLVDEVLTTTRAVRRRLDLEREVPNELLTECIDIAEQAPTGGNLGSRRWLVVRDRAIKEQLAEIYRAGAGGMLLQARDALAGTGDPQERNVSSAAYLVEHLAEVPAIVIPTIIGRHDDSGRPGLFDSVIQAAWSFCLALRARGLGSAWVTAVFGDESAVKELLDIPEHLTEIVMLPVAWTKGTDFSPAPRAPARRITYFDGYARTWETGPGDPARLAEGPGTVAEVDITAPVERVWDLVTDVDLPSRFSEEFLGATWDGDDRGVGATFTGRNRHPMIGEWEVTCHVDEYEPKRRFGWAVSDRRNPGARWCYELHPGPGLTRLRFRVTLGPGPSGLTAAIDAQPEREARIIRGRVGQHHANMVRTLAGIKDLAEGRQPGG